MTLSEITSLRATCLQAALQEAQQGSLRMGIGARAAELAEWALNLNRSDPPSAVPTGLVAGGEQSLAGPCAEAPCGAPLRTAHAIDCAPIRADRAYHLQAPDGENWWLFRSGLGGGKPLGPMPNIRHARRVGFGKMAVRVEVLL